MNENCVKVFSLVLILKIGEKIFSLSESFSNFFNIIGITIASIRAIIRKVPMNIIGYIFLLIRSFIDCPSEFLLS